MPTTYKYLIAVYSSLFMTTTRQIHSLLFETLPSTNTWVKENLSTLDQKGLTCVIAQEQTAGRGQFNRKWVSCPGNLFASLYFTTEVVGGNWAQLLSLSCVTSLQKEEIFCSLKWPNDLLLEGKKVGGVLCETVPLDNGTGVILGIGLNCSCSPSIADQATTSLAEISKKPWDAQKLFQGILTQFLSDLTLLEHKGFAPFHDLYARFLNLRPGQSLSVHQGNEVLTGQFQGINAQGHLLLEKKDGTTLPILTGSIRTIDETEKYQDGL